VTEIRATLFSKLTIFHQQPLTTTFTLATYLKAINMKLNKLLLISVVVSVFLSAEGSPRGLKNVFDIEKNGIGSSSTPEEEPTATTPTPEEPTTSVITVANDDFIEVDVAITYDSVSPEEQREVSIILMEKLNELGIGPLTDGAAPFDADMTLESFSMKEAEGGAFRRRLGTYSTSYIGPCRRCCTRSCRRRGLKKAPSIKKTLEDKLNQALKKQGIKLNVKIDDVQYFSFEKPSV
jgi:hypothetical protein